MKTEITLVVAVLASGFAAIFLLAEAKTHAYPPAKSTYSSQSVNRQAFAPNANAPQEIPRVATSVSHRPDFDTSYNEIIQKAAYTLNHSVPLSARMRYKIELFGESITGPGKYLQKGQGTRLTRMQFDFGFDNSTVQFHQFCDGERLYTLEVAGDETELTFVDLRQLDALQQEVRTASRVNSWLSVGSLTGLMEQLATHFEFTEVQQTTLGSIPVLVCTGQWNANALQRLLEGQHFVKAIKDSEVNWQQLPKHLPHRVKLTLGIDQKFPYFPYRIVFERYEMVDGIRLANEITVLEFFEVKHDPNLTDEMFTIPTLLATPKDETDFYRKRIRQFTR